MIEDPLFYSIAVPAVLLAGISKGGFGGGIGSMAVPLMALAVSPLQAAAVMLPLLCVMDLFGVWAYRGQWDLTLLKQVRSSLPQRPTHTAGPGTRRNVAEGPPPRMRKGAHLTSDLLVTRARPRSRK